MHQFLIENFQFIEYDSVQRFEPKKIKSKTWIFVEVFFTPLKLGESNAAVTLHFENLAVNNYLFLKYVCSRL